MCGAGDDKDIHMMKTHSAAVLRLQQHEEAAAAFMSGEAAVVILRGL